WGCVPSKALLRPVLAVADARRIDGAREAVGNPIATSGVFGRRDRYVTDWNQGGQVATFAATGVDVIRGHARLEGSRRVAITTADDRLQVVTARVAAGICPGSKAAPADIHRRPE